METIKVREHEWRKVNRITLSDNISGYDLLQCIHCKANVKHRTLSEPFTKRKCKEREVPIVIPRVIKIIHCNGFGEAFSNIKDGTIHAVVEHPEADKNNDKGVWVMGNGELIKVLNDEFEIIK
jgi:hypothetical protein